MLSFELKDGVNMTDGFIRRLEMIRFAPSLGGVTTTISHPAKTSHRSLTEVERTGVGISDALLRLSVGIEDVDDIIADLDRGLGDRAGSA
jgi:cystathionine beta-lyase/cystathionine gamma-synthase